MRAIYLVRHGASYANPKNGEAFDGDSRNAGLQPDGITHAHVAGDELTNEYGISKDTPVAASTMPRSGETALEAGFEDITYYAELDEVTLPLYMKNRETYLLHRERWEREGLDTHQDRYILNHALAALNRNISERVLFTHGLVILGICHTLGQHQDKSAIPRFGEVRKIELTD